MKRKKKRQKESKLYDGSKLTYYKTIKVPLKGIFRWNGYLNNKLDEIIFRMDKLVSQGYEFIRLFSIYCFENQFNPSTGERGIKVANSDEMYMFDISTKGKKKTYLISPQTGQPILNPHFIPKYEYCFMRINDELIRYCLKVLGKSGNQGRKESNQVLFQNVEWFYENHYKNIYNHTKIDLRLCNHFLSNISIQIGTMISNNVKTHFVNHFRRFVNHTLVKQDETKFSDEEKHKLKDGILSWNLTALDSQYKTWWDNFGSRLFDFTINTNIHYHLACEPLDFLKPMYLMSKYLEELGLRTFQFFPIRSSFVPSNLIIDTSSLISYFYDNMNSGITKATMMSSISAYKDIVWSWFLKMESSVFKGSRYEFYHQIQTDGVSCSLLFKVKPHLEGKAIDKPNSQRKPKFESEFPDVKHLDQTTRYNLSQRNLVGCDPGKGDLVYMADSKGNTLNFSAVKRRFESKEKQNKRAIDKIRKNSGVEQYESLLSNYNSRTTSFNKFKEFIQAKEWVRQYVNGVYQHRSFRSMKLRSYIEGRRCEDKFIESIGDKFGQNCVIMYGDWDENGHMKNFIPTKGVGLRRLIDRKFQTITTSEAYTSRRCCECGYDLRPYKADFDSQWNSKRQQHRIKSGQDIHRLRVCEGCVKSNESRCWSSGKGIPIRNNCTYSSYVDVSPKGKRIVYRSRDKNAALNILRNGLSWIFNGCQHPWFTKDYSSFSQHPCLQGVR